MTVPYPGNPAIYPANITLVSDGDPGSATILNAPWGQLADRTANLDQRVTSAQSDIAAIESDLAGMTRIVSLGSAEFPSTGWNSATLASLAYELPSSGSISMSVGVLTPLADDDVVEIYACGIFVVDDITDSVSGAELAWATYLGTVNTNPRRIARVKGIIGYPDTTFQYTYRLKIGSDTPSGVTAIGLQLKARKTSSSSATTVGLVDFSCGYTVYRQGA